MHGDACVAGFFFLGFSLAEVHQRDVRLVDHLDVGREFFGHHVLDSVVGSDLPVQAFFRLLLLLLPLLLLALLLLALIVPLCPATLA